MAHLPRTPNTLAASILAVKRPPRMAHDAQTMVFTLAALEGEVPAHARPTTIAPSPVSMFVREYGTPPSAPMPVATPAFKPAPATSTTNNPRTAEPSSSSPKEHTAAFALVRRVALQRDLPDAIAVLQAGLGELLGGRAVLVLFDAEGKPWSPITTDLKAAVDVAGVEAITAAATQRRIIMSPDGRGFAAPAALARSAAIVAWRAPTAPKLEANLGPAIGAIASRLGVLDHFLVEQSAKDTQAAADAKSVFRPEALAASRTRYREGDLVHLSPKWTRVALPATLILAVSLVIAAAIVHVPSYSRGTAVVRMNGTNVIANTSGRIVETLVTANQRVYAGETLFRLDTTQEKAAFEQVDTVYRDLLAAYLSDTTDESARQALASVVAQRSAAQDRLNEKSIIAPLDGVVSSILASDSVTAGEQVLTIVPDGAEPSVLAFMPGSDLARIQPGMTLQMQLTGYDATRTRLVITEVEPEVLGQAQARKRLGQKVADAVALPSSVVVVKARLASTTFESGGKAYQYHDGQDGLAEIETDSKSFLSVVFGRGN